MRYLDEEREKALLTLAALRLVFRLRMWFDATIRQYLNEKQERVALSATLMYEA